MHRWAGPWLVAFGLSRAHAAGRAESARAKADETVDFRADRVEFDQPLRRLELSGKVRVGVGGYQLTGERLVLEQRPEGVTVRGPGRIAFCPCAGPPLMFEFQRATVTAPTEVLIKYPTVRLYDVPVLWAPYLWLRSPERLGLLPVTLGYRGQDGWVFGSGVHVPWGDPGARELRDTLNLWVSAYPRGGFDGRAEIFTEHTTTRLRWDRLQQDLLAVETAGTLKSPQLQAASAWAADALRGPRALSGTSSLEAAARRFDRARWLLVGSSPQATLGLGWRADAIRGGSVRALGATGPRLSLGLQHALGETTTLEAEGDCMTLTDEAAGALTLLRASGRAQSSTRWSLFTASFELGTNAEWLVAEPGDAGRAEAFGRVGFALPLVHTRLSSGSGGWLHWIEPLVESSGASSHTSGPWRDEAEGNVLVLLGGLKTAAGRLGSRGALVSSIKAGWVGPPRAPAPVSQITSGCSTELWGLSGHLHGLVEDPWAFALGIQVRFGRLDGPHARLRVAGRDRTEPLQARWLGPDPWRRPDAGWLDRSGWSGQGELTVPWTTWIASSFGLDRDLAQSEWLGWRGSVAYRHPCGCLGVVGSMSERIGRTGVDGWLSVQLVP
jgi:hypothetical protein